MTRDFMEGFERYDGPLQLGKVRERRCGVTIAISFTYFHWIGGCQLAPGHEGPHEVSIVPWDGVEKIQWFFTAEGT